MADREPNPAAQYAEAVRRKSHATDEYKKAEEAFIRDGDDALLLEAAKTLCRANLNLSRARRTMKIFGVKAEHVTIKDREE